MHLLPRPRHSSAWGISSTGHVEADYLCLINQIEKCCRFGDVFVFSANTSASVRASEFPLLTSMDANT